MESKNGAHGFVLEFDGLSHPDWVGMTVCLKNRKLHYDRVPVEEASEIAGLLDKADRKLMELLNGREAIFEYK